MRRCFPILALLALTLWGATLVGLVSGWSSRIAFVQAERAACVTLAGHLAVIGWFWATRPRLAAPALPGWIRIQAAKHRRKGIYLAVWSVVVLGLGWVGLGQEEVSNGWPQPAAWFGTSWNLGAQPVLFVAEWLTISAQSRLIQFIPTLPPPEAIAAEL